MKIVYFYQYFGTPKGGWSTRVYEMTRRWVEWGADVTVVTSLYDKSDLKAEGFITNLQIEGIKIKLINVRMSNKDGFLVRIKSFLVYMLVSCWYGLTLKSDVIISSSGPITVGLPGILAKYIRRKPFIFEARDLWPMGAIQIGALKNGTAIKLAKMFERRCYKAADHIIAASIDMKKHINGLFPAKPVTVVPNASDNELVAKSRPLEHLPEWAIGKKLVLYTGTLGVQDQCDAVVYLADELQKRGRNDVQVVLIGDGKERQMLEELSKSLKLTNIHFMGLIPKLEVMRWLLSAHISLLTVKNLPYLDTASPNKLFDAFAAGLPTVQNTQGWIKDFLASENCGLTVPHDNQVAMTDAVLKILDDDALWNEMSANAKRVARTDFDRETLSRTMLNAIRQTIEK